MGERERNENILVVGRGFSGCLCLSFVLFWAWSRIYNAGRCSSPKAETMATQALPMNDKCDYNCKCDTFSQEDAFSIHSEALSMSEELHDLHPHHKSCNNALIHTFDNYPSLNSETTAPTQRHSRSVGDNNIINDDSVKRRVRRKWVVPAAVQPFTDKFSCGGTKGAKREEWNLSLDSTELGKIRKKHVKITHVQPFNLQTEQRGQLKRQEFMNKLENIFVREEKSHIPISRGLSWTANEPQILPKRPVRGRITKPLDIKLHTQTRAIERAKFNQLIAEKFYILEQQRIEEERMQKLLEMEEIKRMRKEMVPRAQIMPFFDHPFTPRRSTRPLTIPKEPKFHIPRHTRATSCISWNSDL